VLDGAASCVGAPRSIRTLWQDASGTEVQNIMELRGMSKTERTEVLDALGLTVTSSGGAAAVRNVVDKIGRLGSTNVFADALRRK
jgi:hypothetical protein